MNSLISSIFGTSKIAVKTDDRDIVRQIVHIVDTAKKLDYTHTLIKFITVF